MSERQRENLETIYNSGTHLLNLINEILDLSKIEAGKLELLPKDFNFHEFLVGISRIIRIRAEQKGIWYVEEFDSDLPYGIRADEKRLRGVLINLLGNAVKFTDKGGVTFRVKLLPSTKEKSNSSTILFEIKDTGIGIPVDKIKEIFEPFHQVGDYRHAIQGTGLGLTISTQLVNLMNSELKVVSEVGKGSTFSFEVELEHVPGFAPMALDYEKTVVGYKGKRYQILVVDDKKENRELLVNMLSPVGFNTIEAVNGQDALGKAIEFIPDLILMDIKMPIMDGFQATRILRNTKGIDKIKVIAISASVFKEFQRKSEEAGCDAFLMKPFHIQQLWDIMATQLDIEWIYEERREEKIDKKLEIQPDSLSINALSKEQFDRLFLLANRGSAKRFHTVLTEIEQHNGRFTYLVNKLRNLAKLYQFDEIIEILNKRKSK